MLPHYDAAEERDHAKMINAWYEIRPFCQHPRGLVSLSVTAGNLISRDYNQSGSKDSVLWMLSSLPVAGSLSSTVQREQIRNVVNFHNSPGV